MLFLSCELTINAPSVMAEDGNQRHNGTGSPPLPFVYRRLSGLAMAITPPDNSTFANVLFYAE
ncbi:hypothetical protein [Mixta theicola]|uniref:hypothetical protein n=1 Tax=Mixta theicola TaxID=1458355 RepID=UPI00105706A7|nr:hypothetical protein [Mixta theicola]GLR10672.1 hypothetical protein GCM10007905_33920 [Mixta theicola]